MSFWQTYIFLIGKAENLTPNQKSRTISMSESSRGAQGVLLSLSNEEKWLHHCRASFHNDQINLSQYNVYQDRNISSPTWKTRIYFIADHAVRIVALCGWYQKYEIGFTFSITNSQSLLWNFLVRVRTPGQLAWCWTVWVITKTMYLTVGLSAHWHDAYFYFLKIFISGLTFRKAHKSHTSPDSIFIS